MKTLVLGILSIFVMTPPAYAQFSNPHATARVSVLEEPQGLRNVGMGTTGVADMHRNTSGYYNPASLAFHDRTSLSFAYQRYARDLLIDVGFTDTRAMWGSDGQPSAEDSWGLGGIIGYTTESIESNDQIPIYTPDGTLISNWRNYYITGGLAASYQQGHQCFALGASVKYLDLDTAAAHSWLFDYGALAALTYELGGSMIRPRAGVSSINHDTGFERDSVEYDIIGHWRIGAGVDVETAKGTVWGREVAAAATSIDFERVSVDESRGPYWAIGWEGSMIELIHLRAGYQWYEVESRASLCLGGGLSWEFSGVAVQFDYARYSPSPSGVVDQDMYGLTVGKNF